MKMQALTQMLTFGATGVGASVSVAKSFGFVPEGHIGVKLRWGKVVRYRRDWLDSDGKVLFAKGDVIYYGPGWKWIIPFTHKFRTVSILDQYHNLPAQNEPPYEVRLSDDTIFLIKFAIGFRILKTDVYTAMYGVDNYREALTTLCVAKVREILSEKNHEDLRAAKLLNEEILQIIAADASKWGIEVISIMLTEASAHGETQALIQLPQFAAERTTAIQKHAPALAQVSVGMASVIVGTGAIIASDSNEARSKSGSVTSLSVVQDQSSPS